MTAKKTTPKTPAADPLPDVTEYLTDDDGLKLTINGTDYVFAPVSARLGLKLQRAMTEASAAAEGSPDQEALAAAWEAVGTDDELYDALLGEHREELLDTLSMPKFQVVVGTLMTWPTAGLAEAVRFWQAEGKAPAPNRAQRRAKTTRTGGASTTRRPASGTGTSTRTNGPAAKPSKGATG